MVVRWPSDGRRTVVGRPFSDDSINFKFQISIGQGWGRDGSAGPSPGQLKFEILKGVFSRPHGPTEHIFEWFLAIRMALPNTFLNGF